MLDLFLRFENLNDRTVGGRHGGAEARGVIGQHRRVLEAHTQDKEGGTIEEVQS